MNEYAVVNPATGETVARYNRFTDAQVEQTLRTAEAGSAGRSSCIGNVGRNWPPSSSERWAR